MSGEERLALAVELLDAILREPSYGPTDPVSPETFGLLLDAAPDELAAALAPGAGHTYGGRRHLVRHVWALRGAEGARWMDVLARADPTATPPAEVVAEWTPEEWSDRLDVVAALPVEPRPALVALFALGAPPQSAMPAVVRVVMRHAGDERDPLVRIAAGRLRAYRGSPEESAALFDWEARHARPELFLWLLELSGDAGTRPALVAAAAIPPDVAARLAAPLERPAWADGEVPWELDGVADAGEVRLPDGRLTGGDAWWTGGPEGFHWTIDVPPGTYPARVATAAHPLEGRDCAALELLLDAGIAAERWSLVGSYRVEVGAASLGAPDAYGRPLPDDFFQWPRPAWAIAGGSIVLCSVRPQHQLCRTWVGTAAGLPVAVVTDLGLLGLDLSRGPSLPWG